MFKNQFIIKPETSLEAIAVFLTIAAVWTKQANFDFSDTGGFPSHAVIPHLITLNKTSLIKHAPLQTHASVWRRT